MEAVEAMVALVATEAVALEALAADGGGEGTVAGTD